MNESVFRKQVAEPREVHAKCAALHAAGLASGLFAAPRPLAHDDQQGWIELERIVDLVPLSSVLPKLAADARRRCLQNIGRCLAALHAHWQDETGQNLKRLFAANTDLLAGLAGLAAGPRVLLHGDFGLGNIFCRAGDWRRTVLLDPEPAPYLPIPLRAVMTPAVDLAHCAGCLEGVFPPRYYLRYPWSLTADLRGELLVGYRSGGGVGLPAADVDVLTGRLLRLFADWLQEPGHSLSNRLLGRFLDRRAGKILSKGR